MLVTTLWHPLHFKTSKKAFGRRVKAVLRLPAAALLIAFVGHTVFLFWVNIPS